MYIFIFVFHAFRSRRYFGEDLLCSDLQMDLISNSMHQLCYQLVVCLLLPITGKIHGEEMQ
jgi:hypothetical protein